MRRCDIVIPRVSRLRASCLRLENFSNPPNLNLSGLLNDCIPTVVKLDMKQCESEVNGFLNDYTSPDLDR